MSLRVWLPLNGDLHNQGLSDAVFSKATNVWGTGKIGAQSLLASTGTGSVMVNELKDKKEFSIAYWVKIDSSLTFSNWQDIWAVDYTNATGTYPIRDEHTSTAGNHQLLMAKETNVGGNTNGYIGMTIANTPDTWQHIVLVKGLTQTKSYVNGELKLTRNNTDFETSNGKLTGNVRIGATTCGAYLNDVRIYDHCLSAAEVKEIAQGLVVHYKLDGGLFGNENILTNSSGQLGNASGWSGETSASVMNGEPILITKRIDTTSTSRTFCTKGNIQSLITDWAEGDDYTLSGWYYVPSSETQQTGANMFIRWTYTKSDGTATTTDRGFITPLTVKDQWVRFEYTWQVPAGHTNNQAAYFYLAAFAAKSLATVYWKKVKLEKGNAATPWCPADNELDIDRTIVEDNSGYGHNGTIIGNPTISPDTIRYSSCMNFPENTDGILSTFPISLWNNAFTYSFWIKPSGENGGRSIYAASYNGTSCSIEKTAGNKLRFYWNGSPDLTTSSLTITDGVWQHIAVVKSEDKTKVYCYYNGELKDTFTNTFNDKTFSGNLRIARDTRGDATSYTGLMSDFRIYCTPLLDTDIKQLYNVGMKIDKLGNSHPFEINEGTGTQITKTGILKSEQFLEAGIQFNTNTSFTFKPTANANNSTTGGIGVVDFSRLRHVGTPITITISCDVAWSNIGYTSTGTNHLYFQGANRLIETGATAWQGSNYLTGWSILDDTKANATGSKHFEKTVTIPATWFETYDGSQFGMRCDYSDGNGTVTVSNVHVILTSENHFKIKKKNIVATQFIER